MNFISFTLIFLYAGISGITNDNNCQKYFDGIWKYDELPMSKIYVVRTYKKQYEYVEDGKYFYEYNIKWLDDCKYEMTYIKTTSPNTAKIKPGEKLTVNILEISKNHTMYKTIFRNSEEIGEMSRIN